MFMLTRPVNRLELSNTFNRLNRLMDEAFGYSTEQNDSLAGWMPPVDVTEDNDHVRVTAELPGVKPEDVKITMENNVLTIRGEKVEETRNEHSKVQRYERSYGVFERSFSVPSTVDAEHVAANYEHGVLTVTLPKAERAKPRAIEVKVGQGENGGAQKQLRK